MLDSLNRLQKQVILQGILSEVHGYPPGHAYWHQATLATEARDVNR